jgi:hypothetical protein
MTYLRDFTMPAALAVALALLLAAPAAAQVAIDLSWTSETQFNPHDGSGVLIGGALQGRDRGATWDRNTGTLRFTYDREVFGGTFLHCCGASEWNQGITVPSDAAFVAATGQPGSTLVTLRETPTGITLGGSHGSVFDRVSFSGTGTFRSVAAPEPTSFLFVALALVAATGMRIRARRRPVAITGGPGDPSRPYSRDGSGESRPARPA